MRKLRAFTLMELMIGMIVSSIVTGMCYSGYMLISRQYQDYHKLKEQVNESMQLYTVLANDIAKSRSVLYANEHLQLEGDSVSLNYFFTDDCILRNVNEITDTFRYAATDIQAVPVAEKGNAGLIQTFSFSVKMFDEATTFLYTKQYDAAALIKETPSQWP
jgi:prepilin-type N-terminal cleavage/methylation domain-containing protein